MKFHNQMKLLLIFKNLFCQTNLQLYINSLLKLFAKVKDDPIYVSTKYLITLKNCRYL